MRVKMILLAIAILAVSFLVTLKAMDWLSPGIGAAAPGAPALAQVQPLPQVRRSSSIVVPIAITLASIRDLADRAAPRNFGGKADNPIPKILQNADIAWTASRGAITASGAQNTLALATPLSGSLNVKGSLSADLKGALGDNLSKLLGGDVAKQIGGINIKNLNAHADIRGSIAMTAHPTLLPTWRLEPNLTAQVNLGDTTVSVAGAQVSVPAQVKPVIDKAVNDQLANLQQRIRNDPALEQAARREWAKICRSIPLQGASVPQGLWLELRPTRAVAAQPKIDSSAVTLTLGIEADTRVTNAQTKPDCPFPAALDIVATDVGHLDIGMPIDLPFTELTRIVQAQLVGKTFPESGGAAAVTVKHATVAASGDRLLISLLVNANAGSGMFGFGGDATVHIWGKPALDPAQQTLRLKEIELAVESEAAFGLLGSATRAAMPLLQQALAERAVIDLKPLASNAQRRIAAMIADYQKNEAGIRIDAEISSLRLSGLAFDATTLRVTADAEGAINVTVTALPGL